MSQSDQKGNNNQILRINAGSANELDELFKAVIGPKDGQIPLSVPMRQRNFPASFFKPPDGQSSACHSRESSLDASFSPPLSQPSNSPLSPASPLPSHALHQQHNGVNGVQMHGLTINHPRAHSSPATFNVNAAAIVNAQQTQHLRQLSYDIEHLPLPIGWEIAKTKSGERYFINHTEKTTTWEDPRKKVLAQQLNIQNQRLVMVSANNSNNNNVNNNNSNNNINMNAQNIGALPEGWEQSTSPEGEIYYINHIERSTSWSDPRSPMNAQQASKTHANLTSPPPPFSASVNSASVPPSLVVALQNMKTSGNNNSEALRLQTQQRLQRLQLERDQMRQRQEEILRHNMLKHSSLVDEPSNNIANRMPPITTTGIDPFLGGTNGQLNNDCHSRQESADSGLGLGPNYSLPHTPEDFLANIDDPNSGDDANNNINRSNNNDLGLDSLHVANLDLGTENMESDDLVPSLPDDFNSDILSNVDALLDTSNVNMMTWL